jgi:hypothetical protein
MSALSVQSDYPIVGREASTSDDVEPSMIVKFSLNGHGLEFSWDAMLTLFDTPWYEYSLYPSVSITSMATSVTSAFCNEDCIYGTRASIGAPEGERVFCLDGSLLLDYDD